MSQVTTIWVVIAATVVVVLGGFLAKFLVDTRRNARWAARGKRLLGKYQDPDTVEKILAQMIWKNMTRDQLIDSWGAPAHEEAYEEEGTLKLFLRYRPMKSRPLGQRVILENGVVVGWDTRVP